MTNDVKVSPFTTGTVQKHRLFDNSNAVIARNATCVVLDRDLLPKRKFDGSPYSLGLLRNRWIVYVDNHPRFFGEYDALKSRKAAMELFNKRG